MQKKECPLDLACREIWDNEALLKSETQALALQTQSARVSIPIPETKMNQASPMLKEAFRNLFVTNTVCTANASNMCPNELLPWPLSGTFFRHYFPSCLGRNFWPSAAWAGFREGYYRCAGSDRREKAQLMFYQLMFRLMIELRLKLRLYNFSVQNIVTATTWPCGINLEKLANENPLLVKLESDMFPGGIATLEKTSVSLFTSGKGNIVGARDPEAPVEALEQLAPLIEHCSIHEFQVAQHHLGRAVQLLNNNKEAGVQVEPDRRQQKPKKAMIQAKQLEKQTKAEAKALNQAIEELKRLKQKKRRSAATGYLFSLLHDLYQQDPKKMKPGGIDDMCQLQEALIAKRLASLPRIHANPETSFRLSIHGNSRTIYMTTTGHVSVHDADSFEQAATLISDLATRWNISISSTACWMQRANKSVA